MSQNSRNSSFVMSVFCVWSLERIPRGGGGGGSRSARVEEEEEEEDRVKDWVRRRGGGKNQTETQLETREEAHTEGGKSHHLSRR